MIAALGLVSEIDGRTRNQPTAIRITQSTTASASHVSDTLYTGSSAPSGLERPASPMPNTHIANIAGITIRMWMRARLRVSPALRSVG